MVARSGRFSKPDSQGQYVRQLGWKLDVQGRRVQHKFRLGTGKPEAKERDARLQRLWSQLEKEFGSKAAVWDELTLEIARQIAQGADQVVLAPLDQHESAAAYAQRLQQTQNRFPFLRFHAANQELYTRGLGDRVLDLRDIVLLNNPYEDYWKQRSVADRYVAPTLKPDSADSVVLRGDPVERMLADYHPHKQSADDGKMLHHALEAYQEWIKDEYKDAVTGSLSDYAHTKLGQVETLKSRHADVQLAEVDFDHIEKMYRFWRQRPLKDSRGGRPARISQSSIRHYLGELHRFFKWLHRSKQFAWRKPDDFDDLDRTITLDTATVKQRIRQVETFDLDELRLLNRYATPTERLYLLLGLNCGFGTKEIATLTLGEISLRQALPASEQDAIGFRSTNSDSFISLVRNKTTIAGKFLLFPQTVQILDWALARRMTQPNPADDQPAILNGKGKPLDERSANGNPSRQIPNAFDRLQERIVADGHQIRRLPFKHLRKTAGDLIRRFADGEIAGVFLLHGNPVQSDKLSDVYTNRPFGKVYEAIRRVEEFLHPVFVEAGPDPTREQPQAYTGRTTIDRIAELDRAGKSLREIAEATGKSRMTVQRHLQRLKHFKSGGSSQTER